MTRAQGGRLAGALRRSGRALGLLAPLLVGGLLCGSCACPVRLPELEELRGLGELRERFNNDAESPRLILLLSPT